MKVLILNYEYPPLGGGAGKATQCLLKAFRAHYPDLAVDVVASSGGNEEIVPFSDRIRVFKLDIGKRGRLSYQTLADLLRYSVKANRLAGKLIRENAYHLMHCFFTVPPGFLGYLHRVRQPYIVSLRGSDVPGYNDRFSLLYRPLAPLVRRVWQNAQAVIANSAALRDLARLTLPGLPIQVIPNGIDVEGVRPKASFNTDDLQILYVGRLIQRKGVGYLLNAFAQYRRQGRGRLHIAGTGNLDAALKAEAGRLGIGDAVIFHGHVSGPALEALYQKADVFVLPSLNEGMSNALLEAMAHGLPVVVTDTGGTGELVRENGKVVRKHSADDIAGALAIFGNHPEQLPGMGEKSRKIAESFPWAGAAERYHLAYRKVVGD